jgi:hypothetical protein
MDTTTVNEMPSLSQPLSTTSCPPTLNQATECATESSQTPDASDLKAQQRGILQLLHQLLNSPVQLEEPDEHFLARVHALLVQKQQQEINIHRILRHLSLIHGDIEAALGIGGK